MSLHNLKAPEGSRKTRKRKGRGPGSGLGKTSGYGEKGQKARAGGTVRPGFEGGQMPLHRRLPKRGFSNAKFKKVWAVLNVEDLSGFAAGTTVNWDLLAGQGLVGRRSSFDGLKILGRGELGVSLTVEADKFSASAEQAIVAAGGTVVKLGGSDDATGDA